MSGPSFNSSAPYETHVVLNQPPPFAGRQLWTDDIALMEAVQREGAAAFAPRLRRAVPHRLRRQPRSPTPAYP